MREEENQIGEPESADRGSNAPVSAQEIPIIPPDVVGFSQPETPEDGEDEKKTD